MKEQERGDFLCPVMLPFLAAELQMSPLCSLFRVETFPKKLTHHVTVINLGKFQYPFKCRILCVCADRLDTEHTSCWRSIFSLISFTSLNLSPRSYFLLSPKSHTTCWFLLEVIVASINAKAKQMDWLLSADERHFFTLCFYSTYWRCRSLKFVKVQICCRVWSSTSKLNWSMSKTLDLKMLLCFSSEHVVSVSLLLVNLGFKWLKDQ